MYCTVHTHSHSLTQGYVLSVLQSSSGEKPSYGVSSMSSSISSRGQFLFHSLTLTLTHTNYSTVHVCTVYVHMVERNHTPDTQATHTLNQQLQSLEGGVPFHTLFVPYVSYHHTQHSPIYSPFTSLRFQHTHRHVHYRTHTMYSNVSCQKLFFSARVEMYCMYMLLVPYTMHVRWVQNPFFSSCVCVFVVRYSREEC